MIGKVITLLQTSIHEPNWIQWVNSSTSIVGLNKHFLITLPPKDILVPYFFRSGLIFSKENYFFMRNLFFRGKKPHLPKELSVGRTDLKHTGRQRLVLQEGRGCGQFALLDQTARDARRSGGTLGRDDHAQAGQSAAAHGAPTSINHEADKEAIMGENREIWRNLLMTEIPCGCLVIATVLFYVYYCA